MLHPAYTDQAPGDGPIDTRTYGVLEYIDLGELREEIMDVFGIEVAPLEALS